MADNQIIEYDPEADILVVRLRDGKIVDEKLLDNDIVLGVNEENEIVYIEVWLSLIHISEPTRPY